MSAPLAGIKKTGHKSGSKISEYLGVGKEFLPSDVPTLRAALRKALLIQEQNEEDKRNIPIPLLMLQVENDVLNQWRKSNSNIITSHHQWGCSEV